MARARRRWRGRHGSCPSGRRTRTRIAWQCFGAREWGRLARESVGRLDRGSAKRATGAKGARRCRGDAPIVGGRRAAWHGTGLVCEADRRKAKRALHHVDVGTAKAVGAARRCGPQGGEPPAMRQSHHPAAPSRAFRPFHARSGAADRRYPDAPTTGARHLMARVTARKGCRGRTPVRPARRDPASPPPRDTISRLSPLSCSIRRSGSPRSRRLALSRSTRPTHRCALYPRYSLSWAVSASVSLTQST